VTGDDRNDRFDLERGNQARRLNRIKKNTEAEVTRLLKEASDQITVDLAGTPGEFDAFILPRIQKSIQVVLGETGEGMAKTAGDGATAAWQAGIDMIDEPLAAGGVKVSAVLTEVDTRQLMAMRTFLTDRLKDVTVETLNKINAELGLAIMGVQTPFEATSGISKLLNDTQRARALRITRTEIGRAHSVATHERLQMAKEHVPGIRKMWRRSGKLHSRTSHDAVDGQIRKPDEPFQVGSEKLMFPRDPKGSARHTVNCGCVQLPHMADWEVKHPAGRPITIEERQGSEMKRRLYNVQAQAFDSWARKLSRRNARAVGHFETAGELTSGLKDRLDLRGVNPATMEIAVSDRRIVHMVRDAKAGKNKALPEREIRRLPEHLESPKAVLWDQFAKKPTLIYVFEVPGETRLGKIPVRIRDTDKRARHRKHNWVTTGGLVDGVTLSDPKRYEVLTGEL